MLAKGLTHLLIDQQLGCGSALPGIYLLMRHESNQVDFQDYNEQVLQYITIPNIILNTVVAPSEASAEDEEQPEIEQSDSTQDNDNILEQTGQDDEDDDDEDEPHADEEEMDSADAELEISETQAPDILSKLSQRSQCYFGEWQSLTVSITATKNPFYFEP